MIRKILIVVVGAAALVLGNAASAFADCHGNGVDNGNHSATVGVGNSNQYIGWNLAQRQLRVYSHTDPSMSNSVCLDAKFDWITAPGEGHYDSRTARDCQPGSYVESAHQGNGWMVEQSYDWSLRTITGMQKAAACVYNQAYSPPHLEQCSYDPSSFDQNTCGFESLPWNSDSQRTWLRRQDGTNDYNNGGDVSSASG